MTEDQREDPNRSVRSEDDDHTAAAPERAPGTRLPSRPEPVPGYRTRARIRRAPTSDPAPLRDAAAVAFGRAEETVIDSDDRVAVHDSTELPFRHICALRIESQRGQVFVGTGWFIGPQTIMSAGHCVYLHREGGWAKRITAIPAENGNLRPYGELVATRFRTTAGWIRHGDTDYDYGCLQLDAANEAVGSFSFAVYDDGELESTDANVAGYPHDRDGGTRPYFHTRRIARLSAKKLFYDIDTFGGQSGSPVWLSLPSGRVAVGVHTSGSSSSNSGTRITNDVFDNMRRWRDEHSPVARPKAAKAGRA